MVSSFRKYALTGTRYSAGSNAKGIITPGSTSPISFTSSVQPLNGKEMETLPEGRRQAETYRLYTDFALNTVDEKNKVKADRVVIFTKTFEIIKVDVWQNQVIPHYKAIASLIDA